MNAGQKCGPRQFIIHHSHFIIPLEGSRIRLAGPVC
jgi:hypothetical protein